jgi:hypothetical protein
MTKSDFTKRIHLVDLKDWWSYIYITGGSGKQTFI